ncbi:N-acetylmuramoyl-L-alanine amidase-like domain-containing protein [Labilibaculum antarcticum]|uniref:N-acetylmuramoyl-L-alanine amidase-like domain-containing protein n=1 Tax=Labilibaculum antarcticum TaxID=1717717 RepID=UPI0013C2FA3A|nr:N-acetylmuramoyl-L-alanine amidase-like domain-containing protein [Labilibaculum antarcticum]
MKQVFQILVVLLISLSSCQGKKSQQEVKESVQLLDSTDQAIFNSIREIAGSMSIDSLSLDDRVVEVAKMFMQTAYVGGTLDGNEKEQLVVNFRELDCTTYLENVVALSKALSNDSLTTDDFLNELENLRYRNGKLTDYSSRLHYFSDWIYENEKKGIVKNMTAEIGGEKYNKAINFMSTHVDSYPALKADTSLVKEIRNTENEINKRELFYIPETKIQQLEDQIQNGDLIAITTKIEGLDISHVGIAIHVNDRLHLMNASSKAKKVMISDIPLADMLLNNKFQSGIMVARLK